MSLAVLASERTAQAQQTPGFSTNHYEPSERGSDWFAAESLDLRGTVRPSAGLVADYHAPSFRTYGDPQQKIVSNMLAFHLGGTLNLIDRFRLAVSLPLVASVGGDGAAPTFAAPSGGAIGDLRFGGDVRIGGTYGDAFTLALGLRGWAPTGSEGAYTGDGKWRVRTQLAFAGEIGPFAYAARVGYGRRGREVAFDSGTGGIPEPGLPIEPTSIGGNELSFGLAMGAKVLDDKLVVGPEIFGTTWLDTPFAKRTTPVEALLGAHYKVLPFLRVGAGIGTGITPAFFSPDVRGLLSVEFFPEVDNDRDGDGIPNGEDACPDEKGPPSDDPEKHGCPQGTPPADRDKDGVLDKDDACPDVPGIKTDDPKTNGCPDKDGDGVPDKVDACVDVPGVKTDDPKTNGCPPDKDGDGIIDSEDACPDEPGLKTDDPKTNGCPERDRDKDGILDADDACPDEPGPANPDPAKNGCPKAFVQKDEIKILDQVKFKTGSAQIEDSKDSDDVLEAVLKVLNAHPEIKKVRVEGHTDNQGGAALNKKLSANRAAAVVKWLVAHGIDKNRLTSQGFGYDRPIGDNKTAEGRKANRRVEFHIESQTPANQ